MRIRMRTMPLMAVVVTSVVFACAGAAFAAASAATLKAVTNSALHTKIVVDSSGFTLYHLTSEKKGSISCTGACRKFWPPLLVAGKSKPLAGPGLIASKLGTIKRPDGGEQVTYNGFALYLYSPDKKAGEVNGQGVQASWYAITPAGNVTKVSASTAGATTGTTTPAPAQTTPATTAPTSTTPTTTASGGGYNY
jgi:predicted lipoprotein with Yx(FWY)xxD motif